MPDNEHDAGGQFLAFLAEHNKGRTARELDAQVMALVAAVCETGRAGKLTYTVSVKPSKAGEAMVEVTDDIKPALPRFDRKTDIWFASNSGELSREHPHQSGLWPREQVDRD
ncbi:hypothetical protein [Sciscionella sediminilitoris]|uniref:hypothetical protein n=1 Tax=Sciscionella sediminilitoris TaxID=1445613 RepID=UPI00068E2BDA|nr:hypothetical protein [Sciscionella sp. SE31]